MGRRVLASGQSPKDRDVVEDDGDHLEDFTGLNGRGSVLDEEKFFCQRTRGCHLDLLGDGLGHHLTEKVVALLHFYVKLRHALLCKNIASEYILHFLFWFLPPSTWFSKYI